MRRASWSSSGSSPSSRGPTSLVFTDWGGQGGETWGLRPAPRALRRESRLAPHVRLVSRSLRRVLQEPLRALPLQPSSVCLRVGVAGLGDLQASDPSHSPLGFLLWLVADLRFQVPLATSYSPQSRGSSRLPSPPSPLPGTFRGEGPAGRAGLSARAEPSTPGCVLQAGRQRGASQTE